jgi:hypothetical protein
MAVFKKFAGIAAFVFALPTVAPSLAAAEPSGKIVSVTGRVLIRGRASSGDGSTTMHEAKSGEPVRTGDIVNTGSAGSVKLLMSDQSILDLGASTLFSVDSYKLKGAGGADREVGMTLEYGKLRASVNTPVSSRGRFNIRTKTAVMGVRGTEFIIASDLAELAPPRPPSAPGTGPAIPPPPRQEVKTQITVIEGKVEVTDEGNTRKAPVAVHKGEQLTTLTEVVEDKAVAKKAEAAKVVALDPAQVKAEMQAAKIEDTTFKKAVVIEAGPKSDGAGAATLAEINGSLGQLPGVVPNGQPIGTPGTFGAQANSVAIGQPPVVPIHLQVVFQK